MDIKPAKIEVRDLPDTTMACVRHVGPYQGNASLFQQMHERLVAWAGPRGLARESDTRSVIIYHDDPDDTEPEQLRSSVCIPIPSDTSTDGGIDALVLPGGKYVCARFELSADEFQSAWTWFCGTWLAESKLELDHRPFFEEYYNHASKHPDRKNLVDLCMPVK